jgi:hypothetical protein
MQTESCVFYEICDGRPGKDPFEPGWGMCADWKRALAKLNDVRLDFPDAYLAKVTYIRCPEAVAAH